jgi:thiosulfate/3-mercaptopyruvate sulfurtransferase
MKRLKFVFLIGCSLFPLLFIPDTSPAKTVFFKNMDHPRLIETDELSAFLNHPSVRIVDVRTSLSDYLKSHIKNAVYCHFENLQVPQNGIPAQAPDRIFLERLVGNSLSISNNMWVIFYSEGSNPNATFFAWQLDYLGYKRVGVINGGWEKWISENLPVTQEYPILLPKKFFGRVNQESWVEKKWVYQRLSAKNVVVVDARPPWQYSGEDGEEIRRGHIPGAKNIFWETTLEGNEIIVWKKKEDLEKLFSESGVTKDKEIVIYCRTGREASQVYFTLKYFLGFPHVHLYRGSWVEWSADKNLPVKTGMDP